jgi:hypothetical protein
MNQQAAIQTQSVNPAETVTEGSLTQQPLPALLAISSTHLGRVTHQLTSLPSLYVFPVNVFAIVNGQRKKIRSQKLRYIALQEFTRHPGFVEHKHNLCFRIDNSDEPYDEIIIPSIDVYGLSPLLQEVGKKPLSATLAVCKYLTPTGNEPDRASKSFSVCCEIPQGAHHKSICPSKGETYLSSLDVLTLWNASGSDVNYTSRESLYGVNERFYSAIPGGYAKIFKSPDAAAKGRFDDVKTVALSIQYKSRLHFMSQLNDPPSPECAPTPAVVIKLDFELVPVLQIGSITNLLPTLRRPTH